ncbi:Uncharacterised protein [Salmonella enterica subsp. enterica serovar Bovismorbificans]|uniref:Uncharacterized protein n=1 Tax=Salmonella enterica subsp. enterica serovar Bovismorbificans TaxID=58097 RepID=A0A655BKG6_SALET|nr:Uncharacterised protein [Salmonella enterica subsp. enterica serovar Bovismorbificans]
MHDTRPLPTQYIGPGLFLHVIPQVSVRSPDNFFPQTIQMLNQFYGDTGGHNPVRTRFNSSRGVSIDHDGSFRMRITKSAKFVYWAA